VVLEAMRRAALLLASFAPLVDTTMTGILPRSVMAVLPESTQPHNVPLIPRSAYRVRLENLKTLQAKPHAVVTAMLDTVNKTR
jgi:hypothetical protein